MNVRPHVAQKRRPRRSTGARPGMPAMRPASASASGSRRPSAGSRPSPGCAKPASSAAPGRTGPSPSPPPPTIWCGCPSCWRRQADGAQEALRAGSALPGPLAHRRDGYLGQRRARSRRAGLPQDQGARGQMRFIAVPAWLDIRYDARAGGPIAEFSWEGIDEGDHDQAAAGSRPEPPDSSSATSTSTWATI